MQQESNPTSENFVRVPVAGDAGIGLSRSAGVWCGLALFYALLSILAVSSLSEHWFYWVLIPRVALSVVAAVLAIWGLAGGKNIDGALSMFLFTALGIQSAHAVLEGAGRSGFLELTAVVFVMTAAVLGSSRREWLVLFLPLCASLLYVPAVLKRDLSGALVLATVALVLGQLVAWLRLQRETAEAMSKTLASALERETDLVKRLRRSSFDLTKSGWAADVRREIEEDAMKNKSKTTMDLQLVRELQSPIKALQMLTHADDELSTTSKKLMDDAIQRIRLIAEQLATSSLQELSINDELAPNARVAKAAPLKTKTAAASDEQSEVVGGEGRVYGLHEIVQMMDAVLQSKRAEYSQAKKISLTWARAADRSLPISVQINQDDFTNIVASLMDQGVASLGGGEGVVRLGLHPGLRQIQITVEDNGRGMSDDLLQRVQNKGLLGAEAGVARMSFKHIKALISFWGGRVERQARLGVGSRVCVEIPRVDAYASALAGARPEKRQTTSGSVSALL